MWLLVSKGAEKLDSEHDEVGDVEVCRQFVIAFVGNFCLDYKQ